MKLRPLVLLASGFALVMAALAWGSVALLPQTAYYPHMLISQGNAMSFEFFMTGQLERFDCDKLLAAMRKPVAAKCPACKFESQCTPGLPAMHRRALGNRPLSAVSLRFRNGVVLVHAGSAAVALAACNGMRDQAKVMAGSCIPPGTARNPS